MAKVQNPSLSSFPKKASQYRAGLAELATATEAAAGTDAERVLTPSTLQQGITARIATDSQAQIGTSETTLVTPANLTAMKTYTDITFNTNPVLQSAANTGVEPTGATGDTNIMMCQDGVTMQQFILGAGQTIIAPRLENDGLLISLDLAASEGAEYYFGHTTSARHTFTIGTSPAFFLEATLKVADSGALDPLFLGFRKLASPNANYTTYTDAGVIGLRATTVKDVITIGKNLNNGGWAYVNSTDAWTNGETHTLRVNVSGTGVVTYLIDGDAPTVTQALTFDSKDVVIPFIHLLHIGAVETPAAVHLVNIKCGLQ